MINAIENIGNKIKTIWVQRDLNVSMYIILIKSFNESILKYK